MGLFKSIKRFAAGGILGPIVGAANVGRGILADKKKQSVYEQMLDRKAQLESSAPTRPGYEDLRDPATGMIQDKFQYKPTGINTGSLEGFQAVKARALGTGPSAWANLMTQKQGAEEMAAKDSAARQALSGAAQARSSLAMRGGLSSGARERLASGAGKGLLEARQDVARQGIGNRLNILTEDESQRMKLLPEFASSEAKLAEYNTGLQNQAQQANLDRTFQEKQNKSAADMKAYEEQMKKWAAEREAFTVENANVKPGK